MVLITLTEEDMEELGQLWEEVYKYVVKDEEDIDKILAKPQI